MSADAPGAGRGSGAGSLTRLLHLVSPALPIGAYACSQGLEYAIHAAWVHDAHSAAQWLEGVAARNLCMLDLPVLRRLREAWQDADGDRVRSWNQRLIASRETAELRSEDRHLGRSLARVLDGLSLAGAAAWLKDDPSLACMFALAAVRWDIGEEDMLAGYLWAWLENQVLIAVKTIPLGQGTGQGLLFTLSGHIPAWVTASRQVADDDICTSAVAQVLASALHETQYTRLFRT